MINRSHQAGLFVTNITSDMGSSNQAMWKAFGIGVSRGLSPCVYSIPHPCAADRQLFFMADVPHLIKNLKAALCKLDIKLDGKSFSVRPIQKVALHGEFRDLKLAPKLSSDDLKSGHFAKMKVSSAMHVFSNSVASAIKFMVEEKLVPENSVRESLDTAWFIGRMNHWFDLMSSRQPAMALSKKHVERYDEEIRFLNEIVATFARLEIGNGSWKPIQTGIILSTKSVIQLSDELSAHGLDFLLTSRMTQDCLENLFSTVRLKTAVPSAIEFRNSLKIITVAQFLKTAKNSSYFVDESTYLGNYLEKVESEPADVMCEEIVVSNADNLEDLDSADSNVVYYLAGWSLKVVDSTCKDCRFATISDSPTPQLASYSKLTKLKEYKTDVLRHPTLTIFEMLSEVEKVFKLWRSEITKIPDVKAFLQSKMAGIIQKVPSPSCHNIYDTVVGKYLTLRLHIACSMLTKTGNVSTGSHYGSKSMAMRDLAKKLK